MPQFCRFRDLAPQTVNREFHLHTLQTDGRDTAAALIAEAERRGLGEIAFTEHVRLDTDWYAAFAAEVRRQRTHALLTVHVGIEAKALDTDGMLDVSDAVLKDAELVLGSVHRFPDGQGGLIQPASLSFPDAARMEFELAIGLLRAAPIHVLAHPGGMSQRHFGSFPLAYSRALMEESLHRGIAIEISSSYLKDFNGFLRLCHEVNPYVSVGSDAHRLADLGTCRDRLRQQGIG